MTLTRKILVLSLLLGTALHAHAAEHLLTAPAFEPMMAYDSTPALATDGTSFLAAWVATPYDRTPMLLVQRLGAPAPPRALVTDAQLEFGAADLVWDNDSYLLVWNRGTELHATRLDRDGRPLRDRVIATDLRDPVIAAGAVATLIVAHTAEANKNEVDVLALDGADAVAKRGTIWNYAGARYDAAWRDGGFTVAIADPRGLYAMRFDTAAEPLDANPRLMMLSSSGSTPGSVALATRGDVTLIVWTMAAGNQPSDFFAALLPPTGDLGKPATLPHPNPTVRAVDVVADGDGYSVVFSSGNHLQSLRLNADGTAAAGPSRVTSDDASIEWVCRLARGNSGYAVVAISSSGDLTSTERITAVVTPRLGDASTPRDLSLAATSQSGPSIASNGSSYLAAWLERSLTRDQIVVVPLDRDGAPAAPPTALFNSHFSYASEPKVVFGGGLYLVAWDVNGDVWGVRLDAAGRALDAAPVRLSGTVGADPLQFDVAPTPGGFFIVWTRQASIFGAALTGPLPTPPQKLTEHLPARADQFVFESDPHVTFNGEVFLLTYQSTAITSCGIPFCPTQVTWQMIRLDSTGSHIDPAPRALDVAPLAVASDGRDFAVAQTGRLLRIDAKTLSPTARIDTGGLPRIVWNGARYFVVTFDGTVRVTAFDIAPDWSVGTTVRTASVAPRVNAVAAAANAAGDVVIAYARHVAEEPFQGAPRAAAQPVDEPAPLRGRASRHP